MHLEYNNVGLGLKIRLGTASNYFLYTEFESDTSLEFEVLIYRPTKWKGSSRRTLEVTVVMETNSSRWICFQSFGSNMMGQQKVQKVLNSWWMGWTSEDSKEHNLTGPTFHHSSTGFQVFAQPFSVAQQS